MGSTSNQNHLSLVSTLEATMTNVDTVTNQINQWKNYRDSCHQIYATKFPYDQVKRKDISNQTYVLFFMDPRTNEPIPLNPKRFPIHWCNHDEIINNFLDR